MVDEDAKAFISKLESDKGGSVGYRTYATWYSDSLGNSREFGVFVYLINGVFYYQDFEHRPTILGYELKKKKDAPKFIQFEDSFSKDQVQDVYKTTLKEAKLCRKQPKRANWLQRALCRTVSAIILEDRTVYLELIDQKKFIQELS